VYDNASIMTEFIETSDIFLCHVESSGSFVAIRETWALFAGRSWSYWKRGDSQLHADMRLAILGRGVLEIISAGLWQYLSMFSVKLNKTDPIPS
jgi:hypothetical protein